jgi:hypothetical protein
MAKMSKVSVPKRTPGPAKRPSMPVAPARTPGRPTRPPIKAPLKVM